MLRIFAIASGMCLNPFYKISWITYCFLRLFIWKVVVPVLALIVSTETRLHLLRVIEAVLQEVKLMRKDLFFKLHSIVLRQVQDVNQPTVLISEHEELKMSVMHCLKYLFLSALSDVIESIYTRDNSLRLSESFFLCVSIAKSEKYSALRIAAIDTLMTLSYVHDEADASDVVLRGQVADVVMLYLPGVVRGMLDIAEGSETQNHKVTLMAIRALGRVISLVMEDSPSQNSEPMLPMPITTSVVSPDPLGMQLKFNGQDEKEKYLQITRSVDWLKAASEKLSNPLKNLSNLTQHSHHKVRRELLTTVSLLITKCTKNLSENIPDLVDVVITLSEDDEDSVREPAKTCLNEINQTIICNLKMRLITGMLEENFYRLLTKLPRIMRRSESAAQLSYLNQLTGYLRTFGEERLPKIMTSMAHLRRLLLALIYVIELDCREVSILDENQITTIEDTTHLSTTSWIKFKFILDSIVRDKLIGVCKLLGGLGDVDILIDSIIQLMSDMPHYQKELTLLLNWTCMAQNPALKTLYPQVINHYIDDELWYLPIEIRDENTLSQVQSNIVQSCLLIEGLGIFASIMREDYQQLLLKTLYLIIERAGNKNRLISSIGLRTLEQLAKSQGYSDITNFLRDNVDYISYHVTVKLRRLERNLGVLDVVTIVMKYSTLDFLPCLKEIVAEALGQLKVAPERSNSHSILRVLHTFILCIRRQVCEHQVRQDKVTTSENIVERVIHALVEHHEAKQVDKLLDDDSEVDLDDGRPEEDSVYTHLGEDPEERKIPSHIKLVEDVMKCSLHFVPSRKIPETLIAMEILQGGLDILRPWTDQLLPIVHLLWHPLVDRFKESNVLIINRAWQLLFTVVQTSEDFVRARTLDKVSPAVAKFLEISGKESYGKDSKNAYKFTQMFKLQRMILSQLGSMARYLKLRERELWQLLDMTEIYLHLHQHPVLQECCLNLYKTVFHYNEEIVWVKCLSLWNSSGKKHSSDTVPAEADFNGVENDSTQGFYGKNAAIVLKYIHEETRRESRVL
ncbi:TELO2-interacting protein 1 homolog isoform X2 [Diachasmimorpha longicaudata]|uniref:TELO2-interacting protein 1 homolog isoform X2 n=1 Tax=Diachasmimorpha longicaudata TaxID=58733 RepID=UPI0030B8CF4A